MTDKFKRIFWLWLQCFKSMRNLKTFVPFMLYATMQLVVLFTLINFSKAPFSNVLIPLIREIFGEPALHYPNFFFILTPFYNQINILLSGFLGIIAVGMATQLFALNFKKDKPDISQAIKSMLPKYGVLFFIWLIESALTLAVIIGLPRLLINFLQPDFRTIQFIEYGCLFLGLLVASVFAFTTALVVLDQQKFVSSLSQTFTIFKKNVFTSFLLVAIPSLLYYPISFLSRKTDFLISKFSPEIIIALLGTGILISLISSYFQIGTITRFYLFLNEKKKY